MNPTTHDLAQAHINELRRQACSFQSSCIQRIRAAHRRRRVLHRSTFAHFLPFEAGLFRHP